jgi:hypothetical protein
MSTKPRRGTAILPRSFSAAFGSSWTPKLGDPDSASTALAVTIALLRGLRDRGLLSEGEIDDIFGEAAERFRDAPALNLLNNVRADLERKDEE